MVTNKVSVSRSEIIHNASRSSIHVILGSEASRQQMMRLPWKLCKHCHPCSQESRAKACHAWPRRPNGPDRVPKKGSAVGSFTQLSCRLNHAAAAQRDQQMASQHQTTHNLRSSRSMRGRKAPTEMEGNGVGGQPASFVCRVPLMNRCQCLDPGLTQEMRRMRDGFEL